MSAALLPAFVGAPEADRVYHCDALTLLRALPDASVDAVITDPPYGLAGRVFEFPHHRYSAINETWDSYAPVDWMRECTRVLKPGGSVVCFGGRQSIYYFAAEGLRLNWRLVNDVTWIKPDAPPCFTGRLMTETTERFLWFCPSGSNWTYNLDTSKLYGYGMNLRDVWTFPVERTDRLHPAQKPLGMLERIVKLITLPDNTIVDCFAGSGTTAVACRNTGRHFICGDSNLSYVEIARRRLAAPYTLPLPLALEPAPTATQAALFTADADAARGARPRRPEGER